MAKEEKAAVAQKQQPQQAKDEKGITPRLTDYSKWYLDIVQKAGLSDNSPVRGCMIIKPNGYALWEIHIDVPRVLEHTVECIAHIFPKCIAIRLDNHTTTHG